MQRKNTRTRLCHNETHPGEQRCRPTGKFRATKIDSCFQQSMLQVRQILPEDFCPYISIYHYYCISIAKAVTIIIFLLIIFKNS